MNDSAFVFPFNPPVIYRHLFLLQRLTERFPWETKIWYFVFEKFMSLTLFRPFSAKRERSITVSYEAEGSIHTFDICYGKYSIFLYIVCIFFASSGICTCMSARERRRMFSSICKFIDAIFSDPYFVRTLLPPSG